MGKLCKNDGFQVFELAAQTWASGTYVVRLLLGGREVNLGKIVKK